MASMVHQEIDPSVLKGIKLLHSSDPNSMNELKELWEQTVIEKYGINRTPVSVLNKIILPTGTKRRESNIELTSENMANESKKPMTGNSSPFFQRSAPASPQRKTTSSSVVVNLDSSSNDSDSNDGPSPKVMHNIMEILNSDGICVKCKNSLSNNGNKLVECVDCHKHYHQQCIFPPVTDMDLSDPRFVWYCCSCENSITTTTSNNLNKNKASSSNQSSAVKSASSTNKGLVVPKTNRTFGGNQTPTKPSSSSASSSSGHSTGKLSSSSSPKHQSSVLSDRKGLGIKKRSFKKFDKRKIGK